MTMNPVIHFEMPATDRKRSEGNRAGLMQPESM